MIILGVSRFVAILLIVIGVIVTCIPRKPADQVSQPQSGDQQASQSEVSEQADSRARPRQVSVSPLQIRDIVNRNIENWEYFQISNKVDLLPIWKELKVELGEWRECKANCEAEVFRVELDGNPGKEVLLKLILSQYLCRYLVFGRNQEKRAWVFFGYIDHDFNKYEMSHHQIITVGKGHYLVIRGQTGSGSGFSSYDDTWYQVNKDGIREVLNYMARGHVATWPKALYRDFKSIITNYPLVIETDMVEIEFSVSFGALAFTANDRLPPFFKSRKVYFVWDAVSKKFVFDSSLSKMSEEEFQVTYQLEHWTEEAFLKYNFDDLMKMAEGGSEKQKEWIREFLNSDKYSPEKILLLQALDR